MSQPAVQHYKDVPMYIHHNGHVVEYHCYRIAGFNNDSIMSVGTDLWQRDIANSNSSFHLCLCKNSKF